MKQNLQMTFLQVSMHAIELFFICEVNIKDYLYTVISLTQFIIRTTCITLSEAIGPMGHIRNG